MNPPRRSPADRQFRKECLRWPCCPCELKIKQLEAEGEGGVSDVDFPSDRTGQNALATPDGHRRYRNLSVWIYEALVTFAACGPFCPCVISNST